MIARVLVPVDGSEMATYALEYALETYPDADITALHVVGVPSAMWGEASGIALSDDIEEAAKDHARAVLEDARETAATYDAELATDIELGHPVRAILERADDFDTVVIGAHSGTLSERLFVGNVAEKVVRRSPVPVTVVR
ncbi:universal stress protein [Halostagnicola kamekurae]|uniref:Nucleotide-binding universal stress protein, UspA family n=1 Tax=Halostagnicola kamekurae TaxID=619731 RepID=A0A1I6SDP7_9EURY|nr:universal stress protein [Halostagnicola kamekurae]SFS75072.1 Nucleotide-binding universal stress protein, UspA family [Halostagnicola kamekurae]